VSLEEKSRYRFFAQDFVALFVIITVYSILSFIGVVLTLSKLGFISVFTNKLGMWFEFLHTLFKRILGTLLLGAWLPYTLPRVQNEFHVIFKCFLLGVQYETDKKILSVYTRHRSATSRYGSTRIKSRVYRSTHGRSELKTPQICRWICLYLMPFKVSTILHTLRNIIYTVTKRKTVRVHYKFLIKLQ
jgi:hypothetical protein